MFHSNLNNKQKLKLFKKFIAGLNQVDIQKIEDENIKSLEDQKKETLEIIENFEEALKLYKKEYHERTKRLYQKFNNMKNTKFVSS